MHEFNKQQTCTPPQLRTFTYGEGVGMWWRERGSSGNVVEKEREEGGRANVVRNSDELSA